MCLFEITQITYNLVVSNPSNVKSIKYKSINQINIYIDVCFHSSIKVKRNYKLCLKYLNTYLSIDDTVVSIVFAGVMPRSTAGVLATVGLDFFFGSSCIGVSLEINIEIKQKLIEIIFNRKKKVKPNVNVKYTKAKIKLSEMYCTTSTETSPSANP